LGENPVPSFLELATVSFCDSLARSAPNALRVVSERLRVDGGNRFFSATVLAGRLYLQGVSERGPWDARHLVWWKEAQVVAVFNPNVGDRLIRTADELEAALKASALRPLPTLKLWVMEGMQEEARKFRAT